MMKKLLTLLTIAFIFSIPHFAHADITSNLLMWHKYDEGTGVSAADSSGNSNTGTLVNTPLWETPGKIGPYSVHFNAVTHSDGIKVTVSDTVPLRLQSTDFTLAAWINPTTNSWPSNYIALITKRGLVNSAYELFLELNTGKLGFFNGTTLFTTTTVIPASAWTHVAMTQTGTTCSFYVNGVDVQDSTSCAIVNSSSDDLQMGYFDGGAADQQQLNGLMDDVRIYTRALSPSDITELYNYPSVSGGNTSLFSQPFGRLIAFGCMIFGVKGSGCIPQSSAAAFSPTDISGLKGWYKADALSYNDGDSVTTWTDSSGNGYDLTQTTSAKPKFKTNIINGKPVVRFIESQGYDIYNGTNPSISQPYTMLVVGTHNVTGSNLAITDGGDGITRSHCIYVVGNYPYMFAGSVQQGVNTFSDDVFYTWMCNFNGASSALYRNGADQSLSGNPGASGLTGLTLGSNVRAGGGSYWGGDIAEVLIYDSTLSAPNRALVDSYLQTKYAHY